MSGSSPYTIDFAPAARRGLARLPLSAATALHEHLTGPVAGNPHRPVKPLEAPFDDASALLTFLQGEEGAAQVEEVLQGGGACGAANWSEVAQRIRAHGRNWDLSRSLLASYGSRSRP